MEDQKLAIIAELFSHLIIGNGPRREPDNLTEEMVEPNDALLFKSDLRSLLNGLKEIDRRLDRKDGRRFEHKTRIVQSLGHILP